MTYYANEFKQLGALPATMKLQNENGQTRWITLTPEQIAAILEILNKEQ
jgi:hypothetical protein